MKTITITIQILLLVVNLAHAQDPRERLYNYEVLKPNHVNKPLVKGWASERITEKLNRGLIVFEKPDQSVYLSWRLLKTDPDDVGFNIYRSVNGGKEIRLNKKPVIQTTDFTDPNAVFKEQVAYQVRTVVNGKEAYASEKVSLSGKTWQSKPLRTLNLKGDYIPDRLAVGDLDGDGDYDFVIKQPSGRVDPGVWRKSPETFRLEAYLSDGTFLWQKDLGWNIELGIWYSPFIVYDFDGDDKAEVAVKTAPADADYRDKDGRVFDGPEYCSILNGMTGQEITRVDWPARSPRFGDYNRNSRHQMGMAYLDGKTPCLLVARGTYRQMMVDAYQFRNNMLEKRWRWDGDEENPVIRSQGAHGMHTVDLDEDGRDEIVLGSAVLDDNGTLLYSAGVGHPDKCWVTDIDPSRPGMELFFANEVWHDSLGICMVDAKTGERIWEIGSRTQHVGDGMVADILPEVPGLECFAQEDPKGGKSEKYLFSSKGEMLARNEEVPPCRDWVFWDNDLLREYLGPKFRESGSLQPGMGIRELSVIKYRGDTLETGIKGMVLMMSDLWGDWREELVTAIPGKLLIYSTTLPAKDRRVCLMQDPLYRSDIVHRSMGYFQSPVTTYYLGEK